MDGYHSQWEALKPSTNWSTRSQPASIGSVRQPGSCRTDDHPAGRARKRRLSREETATLWSQLIGGAWVVVARQEDSDAEVLVAVPTIPAGRPSRLTRDEAAVTTLALAGRANKYIAYELGVAQSTVSARLNRAMAKLMVENRAQLQQRYGTTALLESSAA